MGRRLERHVDWDLAERIEANGPIPKIKPHKIKSQPRPGHTYRGARRNMRRLKDDDTEASFGPAGSHQEDNDGAQGAIRTGS